MGKIGKDCKKGVLDSMVKKVLDLMVTIALLNQKPGKISLSYMPCRTVWGWKICVIWTEHGTIWWIQLKLKIVNFFRQAVSVYLKNNSAFMTNMPSPQKWVAHYFAVFNDPINPFDHEDEISLKYSRLVSCQPWWNSWTKHVGPGDMATIKCKLPRLP